MNDFLLDDIIASKAKNENITIPDELAQKLNEAINQIDIKAVRKQRVRKTRITAALLAFTMLASIWIGSRYGREGVVLISERLQDMVEYRLASINSNSVEDVNKEEISLDDSNGEDTHSVNDNKAELVDDRSDAEDGKIRMLDKTLLGLDYKGSGQGISLLNSQGKTMTIKDQVFKVKSGEDLKFSVEYFWEYDPAPSKPVKFNLALFIDYKQTEFTVGDDNKKVKVHEMQLESKGSSIVPITIPTEKLKGSHKLLIAIEYAEEIPTSHTAAFAHLYDIVVGDPTGFTKPSEVTDIKISSPTHWPGSFIINQIYKYGPTNGEVWNPTHSVIRTAPGEEIPLAVRFCGVGKEGVLFVTINGEKVPINGSEYLYLQDKGLVSYVQPSITAPLEKGEYVLCGYFVSDPFDGQPVFNPNAVMPPNKVMTTPKLKLIVE
jgi:hypothetical protein